MKDHTREIPEIGRLMNQLRIVIGFTAMLLFAVSAIIWITMVLIPLASGGQVIANVATLSFWTIVTLAVWRLGAGKGWGFAAQSETKVDPVP